MQQKQYRDTTHKLVHGHEAWMEDFISHYHAGDPIMTMVKWGHNCQMDGMVNMEQMSYSVCAPDGTMTPVSYEMGDEDCIDLTADTLEEGYYTFVAEYDHCWAKYGEADEDYKFGDRTEYADAIEVRNYVQYATLIVPVGHFHEKEVTAVPPMRLSVLPTTGSDYQESHEIVFRVQMDGKPLANHLVLMVKLGDDGATCEKEYVTDANGELHYIPEEKGTYVAIVRAKDEVKDADGRYEGTNYTATHGFRVAEHHHHHHHHHHNQDSEGEHEHSHELYEECMGEDHHHEGHHHH